MFIKREEKGKAMETPPTDLKVDMIREFQSVKDLLGFIDTQIAGYRKIYGDLVRSVEDLRARVERQRRLLEILGSVGVEKREEMRPPALKSVEVTINPPYESELETYERVLEAINEKITILTNMKKELETLAQVDAGGKVIAVLGSEIPRKIIIKI